MLASFDAFAVRKASFSQFIPSALSPQKELPTKVKKPATKPLGYDGQAETLAAFRTNASIAELDSLF